jgi:hypothetical protein
MYLTTSFFRCMAYKLVLFLLPLFCTLVSQSLYSYTMTTSFLLSF